jgi:type IV pilus assembly protein PilQ
MIFRKTLLSFLIVLFTLGMLGFNAQSREQLAVNPEIIGIEVREAKGITEIEIKSTSPLTYTIYKPSDPYRLVVELQDTNLGRFKEKLVIDRAGVMEIIPSKVKDMPNVARLEIAFTVPVDVKPVYKGNSLILAFVNPEAEEEAITERLIAEKEEFEEKKPPEAPVAEVKPFVTDKYVGEKISIDFQDAELRHVFRLLADISGYNIVVSPHVKGKFSMRLLNVPWDQALDIILRNYGLSKTVEGNIIRIAPTEVLAREEEAIAKAKESQEKAGDLEIKVYPINYADVKKVKKAIEEAKILTKRGYISVDERTSSVIIKDVKKKHAEYEKLIKALDIPTPQVNIDAKIVEVTTSFTKELGIQWGVLWNPADSRMTIGGTGLAGGTGFNSGNPLMVNLPASVGSGAGGAIGIGYISAANTFTLDLQLSAMESTGKGRIISNPRIITSDNQEAKIQQGKKIPYQTVSAEGTKTEFVDANLELTVTPHITPEGTIVMDIEAKKNEADFSQTVGGVPTIDTKEAKTQVLIKDGDTLVIGGIFKTTDTKSLAGVPGLSKLPFLGWLFKKRQDIETTSELLIFITPKIIK